MQLPPRDDAILKLQACSPMSSCHAVSIIQTVLVDVAKKKRDSVHHNNLDPSSHLDIAAPYFNSTSATI